MLGGALVLPLSLPAAAATLCLIAMGTLGRLEAGVDALTHLDDPHERGRQVRFSDA